MNKQMVTEAVETFLDPDIRRYPENMANIWIGLRLCLITDLLKYKRKKEKIISECDSGIKLKTSINDFVLSSQADVMLAMAFRANLEAKAPEKARTITTLSYRYKCFLLNVLLLLFRERHFFVFTKKDQEALLGLPTVLAELNVQNPMNTDLRFFISQAFEADKHLQVYKNPVDPTWFLGFHLPLNQVIPEVEKIVKSGLKI